MAALRDATLLVEMRAGPNCDGVDWRVVAVAVAVAVAGWVWG